MSYAANFSGLHRRAATVVDKILRGARPHSAADDVRVRRQPPHREDAGSEDPTVRDAARGPGY